MDGPSFRTRVYADVRRTDDQMLKLVQNTAVEIGQGLVIGNEFGSPGTPVDTGNARGLWTPSIGAPNTSATNGVGQNPLARAVSTVRAMRLGDVFYWTNPAPYIRRLEYDAWSQQAPGGFVRLTLVRTQDIVDKMARLLFGGR